jgi:anti-sigma factor RsiW
MNCRRFQNQLYEYVEGTLSPTARAEAEGHLAACSNCREALRREQETAPALAARFQRGTEIRDRILAASRRQPEPIGFAESLLALWRRFAVPAAISAFLLLALGALMVTNIFRGQTQGGNTIGVGEHGVPSAVAIQVSSRVPTYRFHREGNSVVDTLSYETVVASETVRRGNQETFPSNEK